MTGNALRQSFLDYFASTGHRIVRLTDEPGSALVVVESPAKARTIGKYLGSGFVVKASVGHVKEDRAAVYSALDVAANHMEML